MGSGDCTGAAAGDKPVFSSSPGHARRPQTSNVLIVGVKREERDEKSGGNWWLEDHRATSMVCHASPTTPGAGSLNAMPKLSFLGYLRLTGIIAFSTVKVPETIAAFLPYLFLAGLHPTFLFSIPTFLGSLVFYPFSLLPCIFLFRTGLVDGWPWLTYKRDHWHQESTLPPTKGSQPFLARLTRLFLCAVPELEPGPSHMLGAYMLCTPLLTTFIYTRYLWPLQIAEGAVF